MAPRSDPAYISRVRAALSLPSPTTLPSLRNLDLERAVLTSSSFSDTKPGVLQQPYKWHWQHLEWFGDRVLNSVGAVVIFTVLEQRGLVGTKKLAEPQKLIQLLTTNVKASKYARRVGIHTRLDKRDVTKANLADRFEAYVGALSLQSGPNAVLDFLAPILRDELAPLRRWVIAPSHVAQVSQRKFVAWPSRTNTTIEGFKHAPLPRSPPTILSVEKDMIDAFLATNPFERFDYKKYKEVKALKSSIVEVNEEEK